ncbi:unnamed protein product [Ectocarpus fasciculatus]
MEGHRRPETEHSCHNGTLRTQVIRFALKKKSSSNISNSQSKFKDTPYIEIYSTTGVVRKLCYSHDYPTSQPNHHRRYVL